MVSCMKRVLCALISSYAKGVPQRPAAACSCQGGSHPIVWSCDVTHLLFGLVFHFFSLKRRRDATVTRRVCRSPVTLMLSGVGPKEHLEAFFLFYAVWCRYEVICGL